MIIDPAARNTIECFRKSALSIFAEKIRRRTENAAVFAPVAMNAVTGVGAP